MHLRLHRHRGHLFWHPSNPQSLSKFHDNTLKSLFRVVKSSLLRRVDLLDEHLVPCYLRRLEREKEALSRISLNELYSVPEMMGRTYLNNVEDLKEEEENEAEKENNNVDDSSLTITLEERCPSSTTTTREEEEFLLKQ
jgi:hypothetical protein